MQKTPKVDFTEDSVSTGTAKKNASTEENKMAPSFFEFFCVYGLFGRTHVAISSGSVT